MKSGSCLIGYFFLLATTWAMADISYVQRTEVEAAGPMSTFASESELVTQISGKNSRVDSEMQMKSDLAGMFAGDTKTGRIVRIDDGVTMSLFPEQMQYSVMTFDEVSQQLAKAREAMEQATGGTMLPISAEACQWTKGEVEVEHLKDKEKILGIQTSHHRLQLNQSCTVPDTGKACEVTWVMETWLARKVPAEKEVRAFHSAYAEALGLGGESQQMQGPAYPILAMFADNWEDVLVEVEKIKGYPLRTVMQMGLGGENCTTESGSPIALDGLWADASTAAYNAALGQASSAAGSAVSSSVAGAFGDSVGGSIGGSAAGAAAGELIGGITGMFTKKKAKPTPPPAVKPSDQQVTVFRIKTEITGWSDNAVPKGRFEVPPSWSKR